MGLLSWDIGDFGSFPLFSDNSNIIVLITFITENWEYLSMEDDSETNPDGETRPNLAVLRHEYNWLKERQESQKESWEKEGSHNRRMIRLLLIFVGVLITGLSAAGINEVQTKVVRNPYCAIFSGPVCVQTDILLFAGIILLVFAAFFYIRGATGGIAVGGSLEPEEYEDIFDRVPKDISDYETEEDYLEHRIEELSYWLDEVHDVHRSQKMAERVGAISLMFSLVSFVLLSVSMVLGGPVQQMEIYLAGGLLVGVVIIIDWYSPHPPARIRKIQDSLPWRTSSNE